MLKGTVVVVLALMSLNAAAPRFLTSTRIITTGDYYCSPFAYDWNGDAKKDLVIGQFSSGKIRFYHNTGTHNNPVFSTYSVLQAGGVDITLPSG
jgi:hypothetical protein